MYQVPSRPSLLSLLESVLHHYPCIEVLAPSSPFHDRLLLEFLSACLRLLPVSVSFTVMFSAPRTVPGMPQVTLDGRWIGPVLSWP